MFPFNAYASSTYLVLIVLSYLSLKTLYRVTIHPLARFPGPRLAAVTSLWAVSYDCSAEDSVIKHLHALHKRYGPIVRVRPGSYTLKLRCQTSLINNIDEIHIFNWEAYFSVFKAGSRFNRDPTFYNNPQVDGSILNVPDGEVAKPHKNLFLPAFSKAAVNRLEGLIHEKLTIFLERLATASHKKTVTAISVAYNCLTADVVMHYCYQHSFGFLDAPDFEVQMIHDLDTIGPLVPIIWYFPTFMGILLLTISLLPESTQRAYFPAAAAMSHIVNQCRDRVTALRALPPDSPEVQDSVFKTALTPSPSKTQYIPTPHELTGDAVLLFLAGTDTAANALRIMTYHILSQPRIRSTLQYELDTNLPDPQKLYSQSHLDSPSLPYLRALVKEALRHTHGASARLMRIVPPAGASHSETILCGKKIPAGTRISYSHYVYNNDPDIFVDPLTFRPERWLTEDKEELKRLEAHMVSFSRGSRSCLGIKYASLFVSTALLLISNFSLANSELLSTIAHTFRRFELELVDTSEHDMEWKDCFTPRFHGALKVRVLGERK